MSKIHSPQCIRRDCTVAPRPGTAYCTGRCRLAEALTVNLARLAANFEIDVDECEGDAIVLQSADALALLSAIRARVIALALESKP